MIHKPSSDPVLRALAECDPAAAKKISGRDYCLAGIVVHGNHLGRTLGFPTANIEPDKNSPVLIGHGVYIVGVYLSGHEFNGICNVGLRPTIGGNHLVAEVNILNFNEDIYGNPIKICFLELIRKEKKFNDLTELAEQISMDKVRALAYLSQIKPNSSGG